MSREPVDRISVSDMVAKHQLNGQWWVRLAHYLDRELRWGVMADEEIEEHNADMRFSYAIATVLSLVVAGITGSMLFNTVVNAGGSALVAMFHALSIGGVVGFWCWPLYAMFSSTAPLRDLHLYQVKQLDVDIASAHPSYFANARMWCLQDGCPDCNLQFHLISRRIFGRDTNLWIRITAKHKEKTLRVLIPWSDFQKARF